MKWRRIIPGLLTLTILFLGFLSMLKCLEGNIVLAAQLIVLAAILDGLDGEVARLFRGVTTFGAKLDTYVDIVTFGVAPAVLVYSATWKDAGAWGVLVAFCVVASGVIRFARYSVSQSRVKQHTFGGLPIPVSAVWMSMLVLLTESTLLDDGRYLLDRGALILLMWLVAFAFLLLQVTNIRYAKPHKEWIGFALGVTVVAMFVTGKPALAFCICTCISMFFFALVMPFLFHTREDESDEEEAIAIRRWRK